MKKTAIAILFIMSIVGVFMPSAESVLADVRDKVDAAIARTKSGSVKQRIKAVRSLGKLNDCSDDCDCGKATATRELVRLSTTCDEQISTAARKEIERDLDRKHDSKTRQRVASQARLSN